MLKIFSVSLIQNLKVKIFFKGFSTLWNLCFKVFWYQNIIKYYWNPLNMKMTIKCILILLIMNCNLPQKFSLNKKLPQFSHKDKRVNNNDFKHHCRM